MKRVNLIVAFAALALAPERPASAQPGLGSLTAVKFLRQQADVVALATMTGANPTSDGVVFQLQILRVLEGQAPSVVSAQFPAPPRVSPDSMVASEPTGSTGIWFLKGGGSAGYQVQPLYSGNIYLPGKLFLQIPGPAGEPPLGDVDQQLLAYLLRWYEALPNPAVQHDTWLLSSLSAAKPEYSLPLAGALIASPIAGQHIVGLAAALQAGSDDALKLLAAEINDLGSNPKLFRVLMALEMTNRPLGQASIPALQSLAAQHSMVPGLDKALAAALHLIGTKAVLPAMANLLDSQDPLAQVRATGFFGSFALFADADGNIPGSGVVGPYATSATRQFTPRSADSPQATAAAVQFWKVWWSENRSRFGM
jgi:hypothetical protein